VSELWLLILFIYSDDDEFVLNGLLKVLVVVWLDLVRVVFWY